eukprot:TRINITY_DN101938_c0_g1_i1.p1 TRINITY_DN101938_c0_g1~~TRINITY_DN101938_c0_g1_i1.p1  ORF type:complete len:713 (-),score=169.48 TRINITY_DN101938_c0_g1_i1:187-2325(-)
MAESYRKGDQVYIFYRMTTRCHPARKYVATLDPRQGAYRPRVGLSDGWVPAEVVEDSGSNPNVKVVYKWPHFYTCRGNLVRPEENADSPEWIPAASVRRAPQIVGQMPLVPPGTTPELAIIAFRWGGANEVIPPQQWGSTGSSVSDVFVDAILDRGVEPRVGKDYEVWTVFVQDKTDLLKVADSAQLIFGPSHPARRAKRTCAMYFLYPTGFEEHCIPTQETGEDGGAALVDQKTFFQAVKSVERAGIPTRFPHCSALYEQLASKRWTSMMALTPHLRVPPTIHLPRMLVEKSCNDAATRGLAALTEIRRQQHLLRGEKEPQGMIEKGVAKLGFSWEALDVKFWKGRDGLEAAIYALSQAIEINEELTGQPHDLESIMIQEYCPHDLELRFYVVEGVIEGAIYTKFGEIKPNQEFGDFHERFTHEEAADSWMDGDRAALADGEAQCRIITNHWLSWVRTQACDVPPAIRFDYFVGRNGPGKATVWTLEICELGFSMLGQEELPNKVFPAMMRACMDEPVNEGAQVNGQVVAPPVASGAVQSKGSASTSGQKGGKSGGQVASQGKAATPKVNGAAPPEKLYVVVPITPKAPRDQVMCSGPYDLQEDETPNGQPLWMHARADRWLYYGIDGYWYIGDDEEAGMEFQSDQGYIRQKGQEGRHPNELKVDGWERGEDFKNDKTILVSTSAEVLGENGFDEEGVPKKGGKAKGGKRK